MSETVMIQCADGNLNFSIAHAVYTEGTSITGSPPGAGAPAQVPANQGWQIVQDPLGSSHYLIVNSVSSLCIGIGANVPNGANVTDDATDRNVALTLQVQEQINNNYQLWDFVPPTGGSGNIVFIQNPQTGYVIELKSHATDQASRLVVNSRQISNPSYQLWNAIGENGTSVTLPAVTMAQLGASLLGNSSYVFLPPNQGDHLVGISVTVDIIEDLVVDGFSIQINCNTPYLGPDGYDTEDYDRDAQWMQFGLFMQNSQLTLFNQNWHRLGPVAASEFPSMTETSTPLLSLKTINTISAGTRIIMNICTDQDDFAIGVTGIALDSTGLPIGPAVYWPALGRDSFHSKVDGAKVHQKAMAPVGAFQVVIVGNPNVDNGFAQFQQGMGTITITASPGISAQNYSLNPFGIGTAENSNVYYDLVPSGLARLVAQPFGVSTPLPGLHLPPGIGPGLQRPVIILGDGGVEGFIPGDAPGPPLVINTTPGFPDEETGGRDRL